MHVFTDKAPAEIAKPVDYTKFYRPKHECEVIEYYSYEKVVDPVYGEIYVHIPNFSPV